VPPEGSAGSGRAGGNPEAREPGPTPTRAAAPLRVLHVYSGNLFGGVETLLLTLARERASAAALSHEFALCFDGRLSRQLASEGAVIHRLGEVRFSRPWSVLRARGELRAVLRRQPTDVVVCHSPWSHAAFGPAIARARRPLVFFLHDAVQGRHWLERWASRTRPDVVVCNSRYTAGTIPNMFPAAASRVVHLPVAPGAPSGGVEERRRTRARLGATEEDVVVIQVSRLERWKGHALHLDALARVRHLPRWRCWIVGGAQRPSEQQYLEELQAQAARSGIADRVRFLGQRDDVPSLLAAADVHCQPNAGPEPFGITFVEALYAGLPVVTTAMGGALEIVDERCGLLVPPDAGALAAGLERLLLSAEERARLGAAAPGRAQQLCDPGARLADLARAFEVAVASRSATP